MKHILFLSYDGMTDPLGQSQVIPYIKALTQYGYRFTILSCDKTENYQRDHGYVDDLLKDVPITWISIPYHKTPAVVSSVYDYLMLKRKVSELHKKDKFDMVHTRPGIPTLVALWMKMKYKVSFLNDIRGFWADERADGGMWNLKNPLYSLVYKFFKKHEAECIEKADQNICLTYAAQKILQENESIKSKGITVIPCSVDMNLFNPAVFSEEEKKQLKQKLGISDTDIVFSYLGSIGGWYLTDEMMQFCRAAQDRIPSAKFLFISPHRHEEIKMTAHKKGIDVRRLVITKAQRHEVPFYLSLSNYSIFFIKPCFSKLSSSPTKHGEIMSMGVPVISNSGVGDVAEIIKKYDSGYVINHFTLEEYDQILENINAGKLFDIKKIREGADEYYSLDKAVTKYSSVYKKIFLDQERLPSA